MIAAVLWPALGAATIAALWVTHQAEARTVRLMAALPGWPQDENPDVARTDGDAAGIVIVAAAGRRAWDMHTAAREAS